jgi:diaminohydroxyphosphoribosylaminopyrimidine deaminase/5-amino-6-(5-phosphoribosylamino)uracil reductase
MEGSIHQVGAAAQNAPACNDKTLELSHNLRNKYMGIMVGVNTLLADNPRLNCRIKNGKNPVRIVVDSHLKTPIDSNFVKLGVKDKNSIIVTSIENINSDKFCML